MSDSRPQSEAEWETHQAFYRLTVAQRNHAWSQVEHLTAEVGSFQERVEYLEAKVEAARMLVFQYAQTRDAALLDHRYLCEEWLND